MNVKNEHILLGIIVVIGLLFTGFVTATTTTIGNNITTTNVITTTSPYADVRAYGAACDGVTDDTTAIRNALTASNGGTVFIPPATCMVYGVLNLSASGQQLIGVSKTQSILKAGGSMDYMINVSGTFTTIRDLYLKGDNKNANGTRLYWAGYGTMERVQVVNFNGDGIVFDTATAGNNIGYVVRDVYTDSNNNGTTFRNSAAYTNNNNVITFDNYIAFQNRKNGLLLKGHGNTIRGGLFEQNGLCAIQLGDPTDIDLVQGTVIIQPWMESNTYGNVCSAVNKVIDNMGILAYYGQQFVNKTTPNDIRFFEYGAIQDTEMYPSWNGTQVSTAAGALTKYMYVYVNGTTWKMPLYAIS